ncbi:organic hydroperoxide resistance protein [Cupriavidus plantarum]|uniref:Ohr subfamily peroxiredoxin n=1 Tax=Cupriavidus plantarum TaxID=942865 RepID=A0A316ERU6_9BURK|nr:organic hydroperoxide resistance protein [Cupriavidus plantarum]PWK34259.1 Ohr subfamily peroxiredoxin [Cupriavidus plantarum]
MTQAIDTVIYTGKTRTTGGRNGHSRSSDDRLAVELSGPGSNGPGTNPEQLLGAGWSACFLGAIGKAAQAADIALPADAAVEAEIDLCRAGDAFLLAARLNVSLPGIDAGLARSLAARAHQICPYSKALRGNINVEIQVI